MTNNWPITPESNIAQLDHLLKSVISDGMYLGTTGLRKHFRLTEQEAKQIHKANLVTYGVPLLRFVW